MVLFNPYRVGLLFPIVPRVSREARDDPGLKLCKPFGLRTSDVLWADSHAVSCCGGRPSSEYHEADQTNVAVLSVAVQRNEALFCCG